MLLNRRGYHTAVRCNSCQEVVKCPNCSVALTYHSANHRLMCHYCGYSRDLDQDCPNCGSKLISYTGSGTQRIEDELHPPVSAGKGFADGFGHHHVPYVA